MADPRRALRPVLDAVGVDAQALEAEPSWNGTPLQEVYPWGTIRTATPEANRATALELSEAERAEVRAWTWQYLETFDYKGFV